MPSVTFTLPDNATAKALADYLRTRYPQYNTGQGDGAFVKLVTIKEFFEPNIANAVLPGIKADEDKKAQEATLSRVQAEVAKVPIS